MTTTRTSFALSLAFHAMMGSLAFWTLSHVTPPSAMTKIPVRTLTIVSLSSVQTPQSLPQSVPLAASPARVSAPEPVAVPRAIPTPTVQKTTAPLPAAAALPVQPSAAPAAVPSEAKAPTPSPVLPPPASVAKTEPKPDLSSEKRALFAKLRTVIQNRLAYPSAARRRGMQGEVDVSFWLEKHGSIRDITIQNGPAIFHDAARAAVASASGIAVPEILADAFPTEIRLTLEFHLN